MTRYLYILPLLFLWVLSVDAAEPFIENSETVRPTRKKSVKTQDIRNLFLFFPDSVFNSPLYDGDLSLETRQLILDTKDLLSARQLDLGYVMEALDMENDYLKFRSVGDGSGQEIELRYWTTRDKHQIVGINIRHWSACCSHSEIRFFDYFDYNFTEVTKEVFPDIVLEKFARKELPVIPENHLQKFAPTVELPRHGNQIRVRVRDSPLFYNMPETLRREVNNTLDTQVLKLTWKGDRFRIK